MLSLEKLTSILNAIELSFNVGSWKIKNIDLWPIVRTKLINATLEQSQNSRKHRIKANHYLDVFSNFIRAARFYFRHLKIFLKFSIRPTHKDYLIYCEPSNLYNINGSYYNRITDPLVASIGIDKCFIVERNGRFLDYHPRHFHVFPVAAQLFFIALISNFMSRFSFKRENLGDLQSIRRTATYAEISRFIPDDKNLFKLAMSIDLMAKYFTRIIKKVRPKLCIISCYYSPLSFPMILACKRLNIKVADIQHGVISDSHPAYGSWQIKNPLTINTLPDFFLVWSQHEKQIIDHWMTAAFGKSRAYVLGNLWIDLWKKGVFNDGNLDDALGELRKNAKPNILVTLQTGSKDYGVPDRLMRFMRNERQKYNFLIRAHPGQRQQAMVIKKWLVEQELEPKFFDVATESPLPALLALTNLHITLLSSVVIEAAAFNVPSIIMSDTDLSYFQKQIDSGIARPVKNDEKLEDLVETLLGSNNQGKTKDNDSDDSSANVKNALSDIFNFEESAKFK